MCARPKKPDKTVIRLWTLAGGRCQYKGCNEVLWRDDLTMAAMNAAYIAHIVATEPNGPRGDEVRSPFLATDISNLMLMCDKHHRLIDKEDVEGHPEWLLLQMKQAHEQRIERVTSMKEENKSYILLYGAKVGQHSTKITWDKATHAMMNGWYPAESTPIQLFWQDSPFGDHEPAFWTVEKENLDRKYNERIKPRLDSGELTHLSIFAFAPQPLLIYLGHLLSDITAAEVYQLHREPQNWLWHEGTVEFGFNIKEPEEIYKTVALNMSLSGTIKEDRIKAVLGDSVSIWTMSIEEPYNDFLKSAKQLSIFRDQYKKLLDQIKARHGENAVLNVFPAVPVSVALEMGRVRMPKADLKMIIFDHNRSAGGFVKAIEME